MFYRVSICVLGIAIAWLSVGVLAADRQPRVTEWEQLIPDDFNADLIVEEYDRKYQLRDLPDGDPILREMMEKVNAAYKAAPVKPELDNTVIRIAGYVVPLETDGKQSTEFLLVPYFGACIHVPPPPANQTILVKTKPGEGAVIRKLYDVVWVSGVLKTQLFVGELAQAGYTIEALDVAPYQ